MSIIVLDDQGLTIAVYLDVCLQIGIFFSISNLKKKRNILGISIIIINDLITFSKCLDLQQGKKNVPQDQNCDNVCL